MTVLYLLTFPNGKRYVGITDGIVRQRIACHKRAKSVVGAALRLYGDPKVELLAKGSRKRMAALERRTIAKLKTRLPAGYNVAEGGEGFSRDQIKALWADGDTREAWILNIAKAQKERFKNLEQSRKQAAILVAARTARWDSPAQRSALQQRRRKELQDPAEQERFAAMQAKGRASRWKR